MYVLLTVFQCYFALSKHILGISKKKNASLSLRLLTFLVTGIIIITTIIIATTCGTAYLILDVFLRIKYSKRYGGLLKSGDVVFEVEKKKCIMSAALILKPKTANYDFSVLANIFTKRFHQSCSKLSYTVHRCLGYSYYLKSDVKYEDVIKTSRYTGVLTRDTLLDVLEKNCLDSAMLQDKMYQITVFPQPIQWDENSNGKHYVLVLTLRHCVGDGIAILSMAKNCVFDEFEVVPIVNKVKQGSTKSLDDVYITRNPLAYYGSTGKLQADYSSFMKLSWFIEDDIKYLPVIKDIKRKLSVGFTEVILGAFMTAILDYAEQRNKVLTKFRTTVVAKPMNKSTINMINGNYNYHNVTNDEFFIFMDGTHKLRATKITDTVLGLHNMAQDIGKSCDAKLSYLLQQMSYCIVPAPIHILLCDWITGGSTILLSNMTGIISASIDGNALEGIAIFTSGCHNVGFILVMITLGERLQLTVTSSEGMVADRQDLNNIISDTFKNIDLLAEEVKLLDA